jgi:hypothetical protein
MGERFDFDETLWREKGDYCPEHCSDTDEYCCVPRGHFDTFLWAIVTVFQCLTGEDWNAVMYDGMKSAGRLYCLYFVLVIVVGACVIMNLFLAIMMASFEGHVQAQKQEAAVPFVQSEKGEGSKQERLPEQSKEATGPVALMGDPDSPKSSDSRRAWLRVRSAVRVVPRCASG